MRRLANVLHEEAPREPLEEREEGLTVHLGREPYDVFAARTEALLTRVELKECLGLAKPEKREGLSLARVAKHIHADGQQTVSHFA